MIYDRWTTEDSAFAFAPPHGPRYNRDMEDAIVIETGPRIGEFAVAGAGIAFAAFCVWLCVRIFNRRERWAKRMAVGLAVLLIYPMSVGPACWLSSRLNAGASAVSIAYRPLTWVMLQSDQFAEAVDRYSELGSANGWGWATWYTGDAEICRWALRPSCISVTIGTPIHLPLTSPPTTDPVDQTSTLPATE